MKKRSFVVLAVFHIVQLSSSHLIFGSMITFIDGLVGGQWLRLR